MASRGSEASGVGSAEYDRITGGERSMRTEKHRLKSVPPRRSAKRCMLLAQEMIGAENETEG
jgi:hypothetical protein